MIADVDIKKLEKGIEDSNNYTEKLFLSLNDSLKEVKTEIYEFTKDVAVFKKEMMDFKNEMTDFKNEMGKFRDQTYKTLDWLVGAFKKFDEEHTILSGKYSTINIKLDNHEERITTLEKTN